MYIYICKTYKPNLKFKLNIYRKSSYLLVQPYCVTVDSLILILMQKGLLVRFITQDIIDDNTDQVNYIYQL